MPIIECKICSKEFYGKPYHIKKGQAKYCSQACMRVGSRTGKIVNCHSCNKEVYKTVKALRISKSKTYFCTKSCQTKWRNSVFIGPKHANWKEGKHSYRSVINRYKVPKKCNLCKTEDFRIIAVHHIDRDRKNNSIANLMYLCHNCHFLIHHYKNEERKLMEALV
ncbi:HNH endonuclease [Candidatus Nomurabacteria bacterium]|nr:HNH endonuclease [Candidatus Nomurabacteria bacterium]